MAKSNTIKLQSTQNNNLVTIHIREELQVRTSELHQSTVEDYRDRMLEGREFTPVDVIEYKKAKGQPTYQLCGGYHRTAAYQEAQGKPGVKPLRFNVVASETTWEGVVKAALVHGYLGNDTNGLPMSRKDRQETIKALYAHGESVSSIVKLLGVSKRTVERQTQPIRDAQNLEKTQSFIKELSGMNTSNVANVPSERALSTLTGFSRPLVKDLVQEYQYNGEAAVYERALGRPLTEEEQGMYHVKSTSVQPSSLEEPKGLPVAHKTVHSQIPQGNLIENQIRHMSGLPEEPEVDLDVLADKYNNHTLTTDEVETMLERGLYEQVKKIAKKAAKQVTFNQQKKIGELMQQVADLTEQVEQMQNRLEAPKETPVESPKAPEEKLVEASQKSEEDIEDLLGLTVTQLITMKRGAPAQEKRRIGKALKVKEAAYV